MNRFKWYRKLRGGVWYKNRYIYNAGTTVIFKWERTKGNTTGGYDAYLIEIEDYRTSTQRFVDGEIEEMKTIDTSLNETIEELQKIVKDKFKKKMKNITYNILDKYTIIVFQVSDKLPEYLGQTPEERVLKAIELFKEGIYFEGCYKIHTNNFITRLYYNIVEYFKNIKY